MTECYQRSLRHPFFNDGNGDECDDSAHDDADDDHVHDDEDDDARSDLAHAFVRYGHALVTECYQRRQPLLFSYASSSTVWSPHAT